ncbi:MAG TPA: homoserine kinase [Candidatus Aquicultor sp.]|jgi:homoserine kinase
MAKAIVPATTANLGPGFDALGLALNLYNIFTLEETGSGLEVNVLPEGEVRLPLNERNLAYRAAKRLLDEVGYTSLGLKLTIENDVPMGRGLGSSSTAIVGGLAAANVLAGARLTKDEIFALASEIEGHPDNVGPAIYGGFTICYPTQSGFKAVSYKPSDSLTPVILIPNSTLETKKARGVLPTEVSMTDAVFNIARSSLLASVILEGRADLLHDAMVDRLHQPYRAPLIPGLLDVIREVQSVPNVGIALSGAGPSLICIVEKTNQSRFSELVEGIIKEKQWDYTVKPAEFDLVGVTAS